jgi:hypothetical protein
MLYKYLYTRRAINKIRTFYNNVALKYRHAYSSADVKRNATEAFNCIYDIEKTLPRREPIINRWKNYYMAYSNKWYFAYIIDGDTITVVDTCHAQNMHD